MAFLSSLDISVSGMIANRMRLDIIGENVAKSQVTRTAEGGPYVRQTVVFQENKGYKNIDVKNVKFGDVLKMRLEDRTEKKYRGVEIPLIVDDPTPPTPVYDPSHPDADADGYYYMPNVDVLEEQMDALAATQSYNANLTIFNEMRTLAQKALTIGS